MDHEQYIQAVLLGRMLTRAIMRVLRDCSILPSEDWDYGAV